MLTKTLSLRAMLVASTALLAPQLTLAQEQEPAPEAEPQRAEDGSLTLQEVVVLGEYIPVSLRNTSEIAAFLTGEDLARTADGDAAAALTRVTGLSIADGRFIYVRGLGERYSSAVLNGSPLPSPEPLQRVVPLDLFPTSILERILVQKTYSPEYSGEFGGGVIDLRTLSIPDENFLELSASGSYDTETSLQEGLTYYGSDTDGLGFDNGTRVYPALLGRALSQGVRIDSSNFSDTELQQIGQSFVNAPVNLIQQKDELPLNGSYGVNGGLSFDIGDYRLGFVGVLGYGNEWQVKNGRQEEGLVEEGSLVARTIYDYRSSEQKVGWDGLIGAGIDWGGHKIDWTNLYIRRTTKETYSREGISDLAGEFVRDDRTAWYERELFTTQLRGEHAFGPVDIDWRGAYALTRREAPYEKQIRYILDPTIDRFLHDSSRAPNRTSFSNLEDELFSAGLNLDYTLPLSTVRDAVFSVGADYLDNTRESESRSFRFTALNEPLSLEVQQTRVDFLFSDFNIRPDRLVLREVTGADGAAAYDAELKVGAVYAKVDAEIIPLVRASIGARFEDGEQSVMPRSVFINDPDPAAPPSIAEQYFLPAATITWNFAEDMQLRVGASQTIGRPQFRELAPQQYLDPDSDRLFVGNPYLINSELVNFDIRYEWYFDAQQYFTLGAFYKDIESPVEAIVNDIGGSVLQTYINAPKAILFGAEVEVKKYFDDLFSGDVLGDKRLFVQANYTFTDSEVQVEEGDVVFPLNAQGQARPASDFIISGSRLQGQSEQIANLQLGWEGQDSGSQGTLLVTYVSDRTTARGRTGQPDIIQDPGVIVDFVFSKDLSLRAYPVTFSFKAGNILGENFEEYQELGGGRVDVNVYDIGTTLTLGLSAKF